MYLATECSIQLSPLLSLMPINSTASCAEKENAPHQEESGKGRTASYRGSRADETVSETGWAGVV